MGAFRGVELDDLVLIGDRLELRPWVESDVPRVHQVMQDDRMHGYLSVPRPYTIEHATSFVCGTTQRARRDATGLECAIVERSTGRVVGAGGLRLGREPAVGYWVAADARGRRLAAEATRMLVGWGFERGLRRIELVCDTRNLASARTALAAGFTFEGISRDGATDEAYDGIPAREGSLARFARLAGDSGDAIVPTLAPLPDGELSDGVLALRVALPEDAEGLMASEDELSLRWSFDGRPIPAARARAVTADAGLHWLVGRSALLSMIDVGTGCWAGEVALRLTGPPGVCALGYVVHPAFRGRGYTTRALRLVASWAFEHAGFVRLELGAKVGNVASQTAALRAGFVSEGVFAGRLRAADGSYHDEARFALLNPAADRT